jgi:hypothetical protein
LGSQREIGDATAGLTGLELDPGRGDGGALGDGDAVEADSDRLLGVVVEGDEV